MDPTAKILDFWFAGRKEFQQRWFTPDAAFDRAVSDALLADHEAAAAGRLDHLAAAPAGALALVILLDQVPRNVFRGTPRAFATDPQALAVAGYAVGLGHDRQLHRMERLFLYLPFEHSECLADQDRSLELFTGLGDALALDYAQRHRDIIVRFGRYPHRNAVLGRPSTVAEMEFLKLPGSSF